MLCISVYMLAVYIWPYKQNITGANGANSML